MTRCSLPSSGELPWQTIELFGIEVRWVSTGLAAKEPPDLPEVPVSARDLAAGFLIHLASPRTLREWAFVVEACSCFDISGVEDEPGGAAMRDATWKAAFGDPICEALLATVRALAGGGS